MHIENAFKSRKPSISLEKQPEIITKIITDCYKQEKSTTKIVEEVEISQNTVAYILKRSGYRKENSI